MGSEFVTYEQAAARLGKSKRQVYNYVSQGVLRKKASTTGVVLYAEDVEQLAVQLGQGLPPLNRATFFALEARLRRVEEQMSLAARLWDIQVKTLRPDQQEAAGMYQAASGALQEKEWRLEELELWASLFEQMDETFFEIVSKSVASLRPWAPFYTLCRRQLEFLSELNRKNPDLKLHELVLRVQVGKKRIRDSVVMHIETSQGTLPPALSKELEPQQDEILNRLAGSSKSS